MPPPALRRRGSAGSFTNSSGCSKASILILCIFGAAVLLWLANQYGSPLSPLRARRQLSGLSRWPRHLLRNYGRQSQLHTESERFATLFHSELAQHFDFTKGPAVAPGLIDTLKSLEATGITTVIFSSPWDWFQPEERTSRLAHLDALANATCQSTMLKVAFILDLVRAPDWVFNKWPEARAMDSHERSYKLLSWFHSEANQLAVGTLKDVVTHLVNAHPGCITAVQPVYNNEYEARYTQENDCYQDYSKPAISEYQRWLSARVPRLEALNERWGTNFSSWEGVAPPALEAGSFMGPDLTPRYWDFITFRELYGAQVLNRACAAVQASGARCFHHVPEFFTVLDAVYGTTMLKHIAASPNTDFLIVSSNFQTSYGAAMSPTKIRLGLAAVAVYGKPVYFEAALEHSPSLESVEAAVHLALTAGVNGVGLSNWLGRVKPGPPLLAALQPQVPYCRTTEAVGVFVHLDSCAAFHGLQWKWDRKDPIDDVVQGLAEPLAASCGISVSVFLELATLQAALTSLDRVVFVEPLVLLGDAQLDLYTQVKEAVRAMPHSFLHLPFNQTRGIRTVVMPDLR
ncbi:hypothetical protein PLESTM_001259400 [Pleodorina starrii]|nr:hypothetical protein PLESTM_001259400 [Pleodorina starrii]